MIEFEKLTYLGQVRRLRKQAEELLKKYPIKVHRLDFLCHGENATFKVTSSKKNYLLRLHRNGYHSHEALSEELKWLSFLSEKTDIPVQKPFYSKNHKLIEKQDLNGTPGRFCNLLTWQPGKIRYKNLTEKDLFRFGQLSAELHFNSRHIKVKHRKYWTPERILGAQTKFGSFLELQEAIPKHSDLISEVRKKTLKKIKNYEKKNSDKTGFIHADLHFGNILWDSNTIYPIDFDDCGFGLFMYDLAVSLVAIRRIFTKSGTKKEKDFTQAFLEGYNEQAPLTKADLKILPYFELSRHLIMLTWSNERKDHPKIRADFWKTIPKKIKILRNSLEILG